MPYIAKTFRLDEKVAKELEKTSAREGRTMTVIVERALSNYFADSKAANVDKRAGEPSAQPATA